ncbi:hypothetical protein SAMN05518861_13434 [Mesorhizobium sp. YR577]|nr:hypothetical protein SAMN05518861_13434 [Mesorhizobium sp. YR577]
MGFRCNHLPMGWRSNLAYERAEREEWRCFIAAQPLWRRINIYVWQLLFFAAAAVILAVPFLYPLARFQH